MSHALSRRKVLALALIAPAGRALAALQKAKGKGKAKGKTKDKDGKDDVVGTIWHYTATDGKQTEKGQFRVYNHEVFKGPNKVGVVTPQGDDQSLLTVTGYAPLKGKIPIRKVRRNPPVWKGKLQREDGTSWTLDIEVKDR